MLVPRPVAFGRVAMWTVDPSDGVIIRDHILSRKDTFGRSGVHTEISEVRRTVGAYGKFEADFMYGPLWLV